MGPADGGDESDGAAFSRDGDALEKLKQRVFPDIVGRKGSGGTIRVWCAGCSSGEQAYSVAIALLEYLSQNDACDLQLQLFGTDISEAAIDKARAGFYTDAALGGISGERLERFFTKVQGRGHRIRKSVRERCAFARLDLATDPPLPRIDLVSCADSLVSFGPELRKRVLRAFQFALKPAGFLLLGCAENITDCPGVLEPVDGDHKIYARVPITGAGPSTSARPRTPPPPTTERATSTDRLPSSLAEHQPTTDELMSSNEQLTASNQELQIVNEELQAAKEELQSANETLSALDEERAHLLLDTETAKARAEDANRAKDVFLATLSHELRTPLSSLLLASDLLRVGKLDADKVGYIGEIIARATQVQAQLIDDLLDVTRIATGKLMMELRAVSLTTVVKAAVDAVAAATAVKQLAMHVELDEALPPVSGDPIRLQQIVANLLTNAVKFTPEHGRVSVTVDTAEGRGRIRVKDTGVGIAPAFLAQLFDRFSQEDRGQTRTQAGLGLGLAIVRDLVEAHGGTVQAESAGKGMGTTFTVSLPLMRAPARRLTGDDHPPPAGPISGRIEGVRVLVVEDDPATREALAMMLSLSGAEVRWAESIAMAMDVFSGYRPDLLICDIALADGDGYALLGRIRGLGPDRGADVPALALTALASAGDRRRAAEAGFQAHLAKPVDIERLLTAIRPLLAPAPS